MSCRIKTPFGLVSRLTDIRGDSLCKTETLNNKKLAAVHALFQFLRVSFNFLRSHKPTFSLLSPPKWFQRPFSSDRQINSFPSLMCD